ncbi:MAG: ABC transporter substrate-binding protein [Proteobacteria bacterium]|nr:MAG: ABC transporter substrate-binding protein [Pseudomonadota bacterium]TDJ71466.1 MAG: ABC transporter substrate-binding protein [Pseudomonadota bacterium]
MVKKHEDELHPAIPKLIEDLEQHKISRREFLRFATLLGVSAVTAYGLAGLTAPRKAMAAMPKGGTVRISMRVLDVKDPHTWSWVFDSNVGRQLVEYLTKTGHDNVTRPYLLEKWEASDDLKTWDLHVRKGVKWHSGRPFTADDVTWNLKHVLDVATGSSVLGLMKGYMLEEYDTGKKDDKGNPKMSTRLWDANAIEKVNDGLVRLHLKEPQLAVPEHLFHYPLPMLDPEENGELKVGSNGTGPFDLVEHQVGVKSVLKARQDYWGEGPNIDKLEYLDLGDDPSAPLAALSSGQVHGVFEGDVSQLDVYKNIPDVVIHTVTTAQTAVARVKVGIDPFKDARVRKALRLAVDTKQCLAVAHRGLGAAGEHHHVCPVHPDYAKLPFMKRDVAAAKKLLKEAGHPNGISIEIAAQKEPAWELNAVQFMTQQWKEAGIKVKINVMPSTQYWDVWKKVPFGFTRWTHRPLGFMVLSLAYRSGVPWNETDYANPEFDKLLTKAEGTLDIDKRRKIIAEIENIMQEDGPLTQPIWRSVYSAYHKKVKGFKMHPTSYIFGQDLAIG